MTQHLCARNSHGEINRLQAENSQLRHLLRQALPLLVEAEYWGSALLSDHQIRAVREQCDRALDQPGLSRLDFVGAS